MNTVRQTTSDIFLVRPARFGPNAQTAASNTFQREAVTENGSSLQADALTEFDAAVELVRAAGINAIVFADTPEPAKPDAIFPNNWISTHADGAVFLYPMEAENRRSERRSDIVERLSTEHHFHISAITDLSELEGRGKFLEGTGSLVLDRVHRLAYAALSSRTDTEALGEFAQLADYEIVAFKTAGGGGRPVYHTNVMMSLGEKFAVVCAEVITDADSRRAVLRRIGESGKQVIEISRSQMDNFAGNLIELASRSGEAVIVMSRAARSSLSEPQVEALSRYGSLLALPIDTIERVGGGSVRCMITEIFLPHDSEH